METTAIKVKCKRPMACMYVIQDNLRTYPVVLRPARDKINVPIDSPLKCKVQLKPDDDDVYMYVNVRKHIKRPCKY